MINYCTVSATRKGIVDPNCETNTTVVLDYVASTRVFHKFVRQYFNPFYYLTNATMEYLADFRVESDFVPLMTPTNFYTVGSNEVEFYKNKYIEFNSLNLIKNPFMTFFSAAFESYTIYMGRQQDPHYGLYGFVFNQNPKVISAQYTLLSLDASLAAMGG